MDTLKDCLAPVHMTSHIARVYWFLPTFWGRYGNPSVQTAQTGSVTAQGAMLVAPTSISRKRDIGAAVLYPLRKRILTQKIGYRSLHEK